MGFVSPLRYPGGKGKIAGYIKMLVEQNLLLDGCYVEPYAGGASVALSLLFDEYVSKIIINDIDRSIFAFWHSVLNESEAMCNLITNTPVNMNEWHKQKEIQKNLDRVSPLELGFSTFFLNRTNRSGIITGGVIGGQEQESIWGMDARFRKAGLLSRIQRVARYRDRIELYGMDACDLIQSLSGNLPRKTLIYLDPPYYVKGRDLYENHYKPADHTELAETIKAISEHWVVSYDNVEEVKQLYPTHKKFTYSLNYSASSPSKGTEVMICSDNLYVPPVENPARLKASRKSKKRAVKEEVQSENSAMNTG